MPVVVAIHLYRLVGRRRRAGSRPSCRHVETFAPEDAEDVGLRRRAVDMSFGSPVVLRDRNLRPRIISVDPAAQARDQFHAIIDPRLVNIVRVPQRARRAIPPELHSLRDIVAKLAALRVEVYAEYVEQALARRRLMLAQLSQEPRQIILIVMARAIRQVAPPVLASVLLVITAQEIAAPSPLFRPDYQRRSVNGLDPPGIVEDSVSHLLHSCAYGVHITMGRVPDARLVVENVETQPGSRRAAPAIDDVLHPALLKQRVHRHTGVVRVVIRDVLPVSQDAVAGVSEPLPVSVRLLAVFRDGEARELAAIRPELGDPPDYRHGHHRLRSRRFRERDEGIAALARHGARLADALEVPVLSAIVGVQPPVITARVIASVTMERAVEVAELCGAGIRHAVNVRINRTAIRARIHIDRHRWILRIDDQRRLHDGDAQRHTEKHGSDVE